jgi:hypothetical protein
LIRQVSTLSGCGKKKNEDLETCKNKKLHQPRIERGAHRVLLRISHPMATMDFTTKPLMLVISACTLLVTTDLIGIHITGN